MKKHVTPLLLALSLTAFSAATTNAQLGMGKKTPIKKAYLSTGLDGYLLSTSIMESRGNESELTTPRFTAFFHFGVNINFDFSKNVGVYTGVNVKNIGFIEKYNNPDSTVKRRTYTFGVPFGLKLGNITHGNYLILGGGVDFPFNYKEKGFIKRSDKTKFNEWFSSRTPAVLPYVFVGAHVRPGVAMKIQYYPTNFLNTNYETTINGQIVRPYQSYDVKLLMLTFGFDISYRPKD
jgi:hypothetical protein